MGNLYAESGLRPNNLQNIYETKLGYTDETYTAAVDNGSYTKFTEDKAGYGIAQWTFWSRKAALLNFCKEKNSSIGDLHIQLNFLWNELSSSYQQLLKILQSSDSFQECSNAVLMQFERPADQGTSVQQTRAKYSENYYNKYAQKEKVVNMNSNSPLVTVTKISPNKTILSKKTINRISIHCYVGQVTAASGLENFSYSSTGASCNYIIGYDGSVGLCVEEKDRSWCTSSKINDKQAVTIEVASGKTEPYQVTDAAYKKLLDLVTDICKRNGKTKVIWNSNKNEALAYVPKEDEVILTVHRWYRNKACIPISSEVLTKTGWKSLNDLTIGEEIAVVKPEKNLPIYFDKVLDKIEPYMAKTITCQNFTGTENHRMLCWSKNSPQNLKFKTYKELLNSGSHINRLAFSGQYLEGKGLDLSDDLLRFLVAVQADGHYMLEYRADIPYAYGLEFHMKKERKIKRIISLIEALGYPYQINEKADGSKSIRIYNNKDKFNIVNICEKWLTDKAFNWNWLNLSPKQFKVFFSELTEWDSNKDAKIYTSTKQINLDVVSALAALNRQAGHIYNNNYCYREDNFFGLSKNIGRKENPEELVSCVTVSTGAFLCRQNGYTFLIGNCPGTYLYDRHSEIARTVTARLNNEEEEEMTQEQFNTMMNNWIAEQASKEPGTWSAEARTWAEKNGLISGDTSGKKMYRKFLTREEFATVLYRALHRNFLD